MPQHAAGIRIDPAVGAERDVAQACGDGGCRAAARAAWVAASVERVLDVPEVLVLGRDPVRELVQVRLAEDGIAGALEARHGIRRPRGHVLLEDRRAIGRDQPRRVEEILDAQPDSLPDLVGQGEKRVQVVSG